MKTTANTLHVRDYHVIMFGVLARNVTLLAHLSEPPGSTILLLRTLVGSGYLTAIPVHNVSHRANTQSKVMQLFCPAYCFTAQIKVTLTHKPQGFMARYITLYTRQEVSHPSSLFPNLSFPKHSLIQPSHQSARSWGENDSLRRDR
jgi:hypothetical protein